MKLALASGHHIRPTLTRDVLAEWRLAAASADFRNWLAAGVPSEDRA